jgi:hypothetical protein
MRIRTDGKYGHRETTIEEAAAFWDCNKTATLLQSAETVPRWADAIEELLTRDDLTPDQKRDIAELFSTPAFQVEWNERAEVSPD